MLMRRLIRKNKAMSLIEVLVSAAIFSIIIIPLSLMTLAILHNNGTSEDKQQAVTKAQMLVEDIRANNALGDNALGKDIVTLKNGAIAMNLNKNSTTGAIEYTALKKDIGDNYQADIDIKRKLSYNANTTVNTVHPYDIRIIYKDGNLTVYGDGVTINTSYSGDIQINCENLEDSSGVNKDVIYINGDKSHLYNIINTNVSIYLESDVVNETSVDNRLSNQVSIYTKYDNKASQDNNTIDVLFGNVYTYENNLATPDITNTDGVYDIKVDIYKKGNATSIYETKTSVSIVK